MKVSGLSYWWLSNVVYTPIHHMYYASPPELLGRINERDYKVSTGTPRHQGR